MENFHTQLITNRRHIHLLNRFQLSNSLLFGVQALFLHGALDGPAKVNVANIFSAAQMTGTLSYHTLNITGNTGLECKLEKRKEQKK